MRGRSLQTLWHCSEPQVSGVKRLGGSLGDGGSGNEQSVESRHRKNFHFDSAGLGDFPFLFWIRVWGVGEEPPALPLGPPFGRERDDERGGGRALRAAASPRQRINPRPEQQRALSAWLEERKGAGKRASRAYPTLPRTNDKAKKRGNADGRARKRRERKRGGRRKRDAKSRCHAASLSDSAPPSALPYPTTNPSRSCLASGLSRNTGPNSRWIPRVWGVGEEPPALPLGPPFGRERDDERGGGRALRAAASPRQRINPRPEQQRALSAWLEERKGAGKRASRAYPTLPPRAQRTMSWGSAPEARRPARPTQSEAKADGRTKRWRKGVWVYGRNEWRKHAQSSRVCQQDVEVDSEDERRPSQGLPKDQILRPGRWLANIVRDTSEEVRRGLRHHQEHNARKVVVVRVYESKIQVPSCLTRSQSSTRFQGRGKARRLVCAKSSKYECGMTAGQGCPTSGSGGQDECTSVGSGEYELPIRRPSFREPRKQNQGSSFAWKVTSMLLGHDVRGMRASTRAEAVRDSVRRVIQVAERAKQGRRGRRDKHEPKPNTGKGVFNCAAEGREHRAQGGPRVGARAARSRRRVSGPATRCQCMQTKSMADMVPLDGNDARPDPPRQAPCIEKAKLDYLSTNKDKKKPGKRNIEKSKTRETVKRPKPVKP
ncbi:hypothetical protein C8F04DRAFT_1191345 [Mycena alexandri]|uniref:Uncharacterized protein n=1 Tax=Mycena alexandri TaxID=1745969 RepID=A0AAD6WUA9_9AGAR|nr:hypothetical protein C8F04DRAFT_1191345 [Mycena alexandri]